VSDGVAGRADHLDFRRSGRIDPVSRRRLDNPDED
jgi:hypothetical protein